MDDLISDCYYLSGVYPEKSYLVPIHKWLFSAISASDSDFNPQNTKCIPAVKIFIFLDLAENISFMDGHYLQMVFNEFGTPIIIRVKRQEKGIKITREKIYFDKKICAIKLNGNKNTHQGLIHYFSDYTSYFYLMFS
ncbi:MAG: hypothetical protein SVY10_13050 [Thermodesulfobacteriota bacterium]|nr:hypothetical protein [Thermodesulfobacteriota bacterium]